jgi:hypothetical protein
MLVQRSLLPGLLCMSLSAEALAIWFRQRSRPLEP